MDKWDGKKFKDGHFTVQFMGWLEKKDHDYLEIEFDGGSGYYTQNGDMTLTDKELDEFLDECMRFKRWRESR